MTALIAALAAAAPGEGHRIESEADLVLPTFKTIKFLGMSGWTLLAIGLAEQNGSGHLAGTDCRPDPMASKSSGRSGSG